MSLYEIIIGVVLITIMFILFVRINRKSKAIKSRIKHLDTNGTDILIVILSMKSTDLRLEGQFVLDLKLQLENKTDNSAWIIDSYMERAARLALGSYHKEIVYLGKMGDSREEVIFVKDESERPVPAKINNIH